MVHCWGWLAYAVYVVCAVGYVVWSVCAVYVVYVVWSVYAEIEVMHLPDCCKPGKGRNCR